MLFSHFLTALRVLLIPNITVWTILLQINLTSDSTMSLIGTALVEHSMLLLLKNLTIEGQKKLSCYCCMQLLNRRQLLTYIGLGL